MPVCRHSTHWLLLFLVGFFVGSLQGQVTPKPSDDKPPVRPAAGGVKIEELPHLQTMLAEVRQALVSDSKRAIELADRLITELNKIRAVRLLSTEQGQIYETALLLKARALHAQKDEAGARRTLRLLLSFNPDFTAEGGFPREAEWMDEIRAKEMGSVWLSTVQKDVMVRVNQHLTAKIMDQPIQLRLLAGTYEVIFEKEDYLAKPIFFTVAGGDNQERPKAQMKREFFKMPFFVTAPDVEVLMEDKTVGRTRPFTEIMADLDAGLRERLLTFLENQNINASHVSFILVNKVPMADAISFSFHKPCYIDERQTLALTGAMRQALNENAIFPLSRATSLIDMTSNQGSLNITSNLPEADVFLNDEHLGKTPIEAPVCPGRYTLEVRHEGGRLRQRIAVSESEDLDIEVELHPTLTFLGIHPSEFVAADLHSEAKRVVEATLKDRVEYFKIETATQTWLEEFFRENDLNLAGFVAALSSPVRPHGQMTAVVESLAEGLGSNLLLIGYFDIQEPSPTVVNLALFSRYHGHPDITRVDFRSAQDLKLFANKIEVPENIADIFYEPWFGAKMVDVDIDKETLPVIIDVQSGSPARTVGLKAGDVLLQVDGRPRTTLEIIKHLGTKKQDDSARLIVRSVDGAEKAHSVKIIHAPVEIPIRSRDIFFNVYLTKLTIFTFGEESEQPVALAYLNMARLHMLYGDYQGALELLKEAKLQGTRGLSQGTVHYYRGQCLEQLGEKAKAREAYQEALAFDGSTIGSSEGLQVSTLAKERLNALK